MLALASDPIEDCAAVPLAGTAALATGRPSAAYSHSIVAAASADPIPNHLEA